MPHIQTQSEWEEEMCQKILQFVRHELYFELRYMEPAFSALAYHRADGLLTFATDGGRLYFSAEPTLRIFRKNTAFLDRVYLHTVLHCVFRHLWLRDGRDKRLWGIACDIAVEHTVDAMDKNCTKRILSWLRKDTYESLKKEGHGTSAAVIYRRLIGLETEKVQALAKEFYTDDHRFWPGDEEMHTSVCNQTRRNWDRTARQVTIAKERRGDEPKEGEEALAAQIRAGNSRRSYADFLRKFAVLQEEARLDPDEFDLGYYTYGLRLYGSLPLVEPLETREVRKIREFVIVIDTSYSTNGALVEGFLKETAAILSQKNSFFETYAIRILQCDEKVRDDISVCSRRDMERALQGFQLLGGGGTDFRPAFSYVETLRARGELTQLGGLLYFTDGKGIYPEKKPDYKTAFLFLEDYEEAAAPPWAMRLRLEPEEWLHEY